MDFGLSADSSQEGQKNEEMSLVTEAQDNRGEQ
jgi:hypothetical protein